MFDVETKIRLNKDRLEKDLDSIQRIQNRYPLYFAFLGLVGLYIFDFVTYIKNYNHERSIDTWILILLIITFILLAISLYKFILLIIPQKIYYDKLPEEIYKEYYENIKDFLSADQQTLIEETNSGYLEYLELSVRKNFNIYVKKRFLYYQVVLFSLISLFPYIILLLIKFIYYG